MREYADKVGKSKSEIDRNRSAASVMQACPLNSKDRHLAELHAAPRWLWRVLVAKLIAEDWTVETAKPGAKREISSKVLCLAEGIGVRGRGKWLPPKNLSSSG